MKKDTSTPQTDNIISVFQLEQSAIRGRSIKLGSAIDEALGTNRYPEPISKLLGEAMMIGALVARALKFEGRLVVQCHGTNEGAVSLLMADCSTNGDIRGYARFDQDRLTEILKSNPRPGADVLLGDGTFSMTIDQGPDMDQYQGMTAIEGPDLSSCAEHFFMQSEQVPTRIRLACGQIQLPGKQESWRGGGMMIQQIAADAERGETEDDWQTAKALFDTLSDEELMDPQLAQNDLLYRLFHEEGVRIVETLDVQANCRCSRERIENTLRSFNEAELRDSAEDGVITVGCEFCDTSYKFALGDLLQQQEAAQAQ